MWLAWESLLPVRMKGQWDTEPASVSPENATSVLASVGPVGMGDFLDSLVPGLTVTVTAQ